MSQKEVIAAIISERAAQDEQWGPQHHPDGLEELGPLGPPMEASARRSLYYRTNWAGILLEEVGEALQAKTPEELRNELVQVAAVVVNWLEDLEKR